MAIPRLYKRVTVAAMFHAHIQTLIRTLEPHLTVAQKKQLKKEGKYKGQQERYSNLLGEHAKPFCADYVRQLVIGVSDPGRKHAFIVDRYLEEALQNFRNLEIVETRVLTESMAESLASLGSLKALCLFSDHISDESMNLIATIKNLKHLAMDYADHRRRIGGHGSAIRAMLLNSASTLQSLTIPAGSLLYGFLEERDEKVLENKLVAHQPLHLSALQALDISYMPDDEAFITSLQRAIDLMALRELRLHGMSQGKELIYQRLSSLAQKTTRDIRLRSLYLDMSAESYGASFAQNMPDYRYECGFISSFDTLTALEISGYGLYPDYIANPGLSDLLLQAISKHRNLTSLTMSYPFIPSGCKVPYLSADTVSTIVKNLPHLQVLHFAPDEDQSREIGLALSNAADLTTVSCFPFEGWAKFPRPDDPCAKARDGIIQGFLSRGGWRGVGKFVWEDNYKLRRLVFHQEMWDIGSAFHTFQRGMKKAQKRRSDDDEECEVLIRDISSTLNKGIHIGYDPDFKWVEMAAKGIV
ncbi:hypothetical protein FZEAL_8849 [Fusarium zealandicum]|uniref:Uncharacterized protein n=1 Tax=Fusarium zealandicum TaxID=1053134 RepID=A0A8H4UD36_9HYPO|nr:hypothetical protein FZEAL_8849 [Fusarium zealandicum]